MLMRVKIRKIKVGERCHERSEIKIMNDIYIYIYCVYRVIIRVKEYFLTFLKQTKAFFKLMLQKYKSRKLAFLG